MEKKLKHKLPIKESFKNRTRILELKLFEDQPKINLPKKIQDNQNKSELPVYHNKKVLRNKAKLNN